MKIKFLGTGAADWAPESLDSNGRHRYFSSALIDDVLLIDPGPHIFESAEKYCIDLSSVKYIINTHPHSDHLHKENLEKLVSAGAEFTVFHGKEHKELG